MGIRRQGWQWSIADLGNLPPKDLNLLENRPQSVFYSGIGDATIHGRNYTKADQFLVLQYIGSTPGVYGAGAAWVPGGYVNIRIGTTMYYQTLDGRDYVGMSGTSAPYPITNSDSPVMKNWIPIEIPPGTDWDVTYYLANALVPITEDFPNLPVTDFVIDSI
jgi:hypothetical protein